jgi:DNA polymerase III subunit delta'
VVLFSSVVGQEAAVRALWAAVRRPVHAYLLVGPAGTGKRAAAVDFAAALLCPQGGDGTCESCRRVRDEVHPDVEIVEREGASIGIDAARHISRLAARSPVEADRKVLILTDFHLVKDAGPALLKTVEEPPASAVFVILAEHVPPELVTIASRCVRIDFRPLSPDEVVAALVDDGVAQERAVELAGAAGGRLDRARLLASDPEFERRQKAWLEVPRRLDGHGATAARLADELLALLEGSVAPLRARHENEAADLEEQNARNLEVNGKVGRNRGGVRTGLKELEERQRREVRRQRTDELRAGLATLAGGYRDRIAAAAASESGASERQIVAGLEAVGLIQAQAEALEFYPGELLQLQALLSRLGRLQV